jgi:L-alanine-DL-glutamate epimerase-like enolase superfamily enzyme
MKRSDPAIDAVEAAVFVIPTDLPESDGTIEWDSTTLVLATVHGGGRSGHGYTYTSRAAGALIDEKLGPVIRGHDALATRAAWDAMVRAVRNIGSPGVAAAAISAVDVALWDLKAKLLNQPLARLIGQVRESVPVYGSGGFTSYSDEQLTAQLAGWAEAGIRDVKMKIGREPAWDPERVSLARQAIGPHVGLFVDANGAYDLKQALRLSQIFADQDVSWFEEPVSSDDLDGLRLMVERAPARMEIAAGEYGYDASYFRRMLQARAVDVLQADATRCGGITGFLMAGVLADACGMPLSAHTAPTLHGHLGCVCPRVRNVEYFHDHARVEPMLFEGALVPQKGMLAPDAERPGLGLTLKEADAQRFAA